LYGPDSRLAGHGISLEANDENSAHEIQESSFRLSFCPCLSAPPQTIVYYDVDHDGVSDDFYYDWYRNGTIFMCINRLGNESFSMDTFYDILQLPHIDVDGDGQRDDLFADIGLNNRTNILIDANAAWMSDGIDSDNDGNITGVDFNGNGNMNEWVGVDECCLVLDNSGVGYDWYWDDELRSDLSTLSCDKLIFVREGCAEGNQSCFSGGLIDDLSAPNRIIMCSSNETTESFAWTGGFGCWAKPFIDAMHGEEVTWNGTGVAHTGVKVNADLNNDGHVTLNETWQYAWSHDSYRINGKETPWRDDNGNGLPTFKDGQDVLDATDGALSEQTFLEPNLATILNSSGFKNIEDSTDETFSSGRYNVTLYAEYGSYYNLNNLSWYPVGTSSYNLIFSGTDGRFGYVQPPINRSFSTTSTFGLSFGSGDNHRYFTETSRNPDAPIKHAKVYKNKDNLNMYLIGFENWYGDGSDKDYNDMVISLENVNNPPNTPSTPSGEAYPYKGDTYTYSTSTTDPNGDNVYYQFDWGDSSQPTTVGPYTSGATASAQHTWNAVGTFNVKVKAKDPYDKWSNWSQTLTVEVCLHEGCPYVYAWDGEKYVKDNNLLPTSLKNNGADVEDYYKLEQILVPKYRGKFFSLYQLQISEFENEHSYIDQAKLLAIDHSVDCNIAVTPEGNIVTYRQPHQPISCVDSDGSNRLSQTQFMDGNVSDPLTYFYGETGDYLILNFGGVDTRNAKLILRSDMKCEDPPYCCIEVQVLNGGQWQIVSLVAPREYWATEAVDMSPYVAAGQELVVRLYWTLPHRLDYVGLDTAPQDSFEIHYASLVSATHSAEGNVIRRLLQNDEVYAELVPGQQIQLAFLMPSKSNQNQERTFIFYTEGHYDVIQ